ncbi:MAG: hypothetical protein HRT66_05235 [Flavobacteriaceae bacterium]|nr:hypothetical protein [Flavobacteriaceae bacterium]
MRKFLNIALVAVLGLSLLNCDDKEELNKSVKALITKFDYLGANVTVNLDRSLNINLPYGTDISEANATVTISEGATIEPDPATVVFVSGEPQVFTVTAEDTSIKEVFIVTVTVLDNEEALIKTFSYLEETIDVADAINIDLPYGSIIGDAKATITISDDATIEPNPDETAFVSGEPQVFTVTSQEGSTTKNYTIKVTVLGNTEALMTSFTYKGDTETIADVIFIDLPYDSVIESDKATIEISDDATIEPKPNETAFVSGEPQVFTVTSQDGNTHKNYTVLVTIADPEQGSKVKLINDQWVLDETGTHIGIWKMEDLQAMKDGLSASYVLMKNLDFNNNSDYRNGDSTYMGPEGFMPVGNRSAPFTGDLNGNKKAISNLYINRDMADNVGLFGVIINALNPIRDLGLIDCDITGNSYVGGLVGDANGLYIYDSYVKGTISSTGDYAGGMAGRLISSSVNNSYSEGTITGGDRRTGGLIGSFNGTVNNSYSAATVNGNGDSTGGLIGRASTSIDVDTPSVSNSYATGNVTGGGDTGGLIGTIGENTYVINSYATGDVTGGGNTGGLIGKMSGAKLENSIAFNNNVSGDTLLGKVVGLSEEAIVMAGSIESIVSIIYHNTSMTTSTGSTSDSEDGTSISDMMDNQNSADASLNIIGYYLSLTDPGGNIWEMKAGAARPTLVGVGDDTGLLNDVQ